MAPTREKEKKILVALLAVLALLIGYRATTAEKPKTAPLAYPRGSVAHSAVRQGAAAASRDDDPLNTFLAKRQEKFSGVSRNIFLMEDPAPRPKPDSVPVEGLIGPSAPPPPPPPPPPEKPLWQIRREEALQELGKFRFLGYLTDKDNKLFLSKDGELFIVKSGETVVKGYKVKEAGRDYIILFDTATEAELRVELSGSEPQQPQPRTWR